MSTNEPTPSSPQHVNGAPKKTKKNVDPARVEQMAGQLKSAVQQGRPWRLAVFFGGLLLCLVPLGLIAWAFWPREPPPELQVVAFDELVVGPPAEFKVRAQLIVADGQTGTVHFPGCEVFVSQELPPAPGQKPVSAPPDGEGVVSCAWQAPPPGPMALYRVTYSDVARKKLRDDRARVWVVPRGAKLLLVDVRALRDIPEEAAAKKALQKARSAGHVVAYLTGDDDDVRRYLRARDWVLEKRYPDGPVLYRSGTNPDGIERWRKDLASVVVVLPAPGRNWAELEKKWAAEK
jgi:hypothetical protein